MSMESVFRRMMKKKERAAKPKPKKEPSQGNAARPMSQNRAGWKARKHSLGNRVRRYGG